MPGEVFTLNQFDGGAVRVKILQQRGVFVAPLGQRSFAIARFRERGGVCGCVRQGVLQNQGMKRRQLKRGLQAGIKLISPRQPISLCVDGGCSVFFDKPTPVRSYV